ncbi:MAG TPA: arylamine N-acetyltransferase [Thermoanaerobaculia bacterium]|nr:arylamine N-acetyltransferase [Thermoanaerobaculia bacterium]
MATWLDAYLARIGYDGPREPTLETLRVLHERHLFSVPFENLDIHWKRPIVVDVERFLNKVIEQKRGGFCYELNGAFAALLRELGFDVSLLSGRVITEAGSYGPPFDHMALLVRLDDGSRWLADVGFGQSFLGPLSLDVETGQRDRAGTYRIVPGEEWAMQVLKEGEWATEYLFTLDPHDLPEFAPMCDYQQYSPESSFLRRRVCTLATEWGRVTLTDGKLITTREGVREEREVAEGEWGDVLRETFGAGYIQKANAPSVT